jgi:phosphoribosyl 1,2-cyclic phosphate phosphodiesterase
MEIKFLGSGGVLGVPVWSCNCDICKNIDNDKRNIRTRPSIIVSFGNKKILIDIGPDFRNQMLRENITHIDHLFITHNHTDHISSINELRAANDLSLEIPSDILNNMIIEKDNILNYITVRNSSLKIKEFVAQKIGDIFIDIIKVKHDKDFTNTKFPTFGYLFVEGDFRVAYIPDYCEIIDVEKVKNLDVFISDGAFLQEKWGHVGVEGSIKIYNKYNPKLMLLTHLNHYMSHNDLEKYLLNQGNIKPAYDGLIIKS